MRLNRTARSTTATEETGEFAAPSPDQRLRLLPSAGIREGDVPPAECAGMSNTMRTIIWISGVAFGIAAPGAYAQSALDSGATPPNPAFVTLDANHDGFVSREEAKQDKTVSSTFDQADMNHDGKLDEDELIKALAIGQRESVEKIALEGASAAKHYAADSEVTARVKAALLRTEGLRSLEISVQTYKGKVQLAGFADSKVQIAQAGKIAEHEPGVKAVLNDLVVK